MASRQLETSQKSLNTYLIIVQQVDTMVICKASRVIPSECHLMVKKGLLNHHYYLFPHVQVDLVNIGRRIRSMLYDATIRNITTLVVQSGMLVLVRRGRTIVPDERYCCAQGDTHVWVPTAIICCCSVLKYAIYSAAEQ